MLDLTGLRDLVDLDRPDLKSEPWTPVTPPRLVPPDEDEPADVFAAIRAGDLLVHHPYESFAASVERFIGQAVDDPEVLTIKLTLYRTSGDSPIVRDLIRAAERGKQVVVLVEIKARFDEEANIVWARKLEQAGAHVVYGLVGLKTHSKVGPRRPPRGRRASAATSTSAPATTTRRPPASTRTSACSRCRPELGADVTDLFNVLTGLSRQRDVPAAARRAAQPPVAVPRARRARDRARRASATRPGSSLKLNAIVDRALDRGALPGVAGRRPGRPHRPRRAARCCRACKGVSENIRVRSIVGEFLEHSRIWGFANGGDADWYIGSADLMDRNLDRRVEAMVPVEDPEARGAARRDRRGHARRRPPLVAARPGRGPGGGPRRSSASPGTLRHPRGAEGAGARRLDGHRGPAPAARPVPARSTRGHERRTIGRREPRRPPPPRPRRDRAEVPASGDEAAGDRYLRGRRARRASTRAVAVRSTQVEDRYIDTADGALARAGFAARLRQTAKATTVAVKSAVRRDGDERRASIAARSSRARPTGPPPPRDWPPSDARSLILEQCGDAPLVELVTIRQLRRKRNLERDGTIVEVSLDEVDAVTRSRVVGRFVELEVELLKRRRGRRSPRIDGRPRGRPGPHAGGRVQARVRPRSDRGDGATQAKQERARSLPPDRTRRGADGRSSWFRRQGSTSARIVEAVTTAEIEAAADADRAQRGAGGRRTPASDGRRAPATAAKALARGPGVRQRDGGAGDRRRPGSEPADADAEPAAASRRRQDARRHRRRPRRRGRPEGPPLPPRADDRQGAGTRDGDGSRGPPRDAGRDPPPAGGVARLRRRVPRRSDEDPPPPPPRGRLAAGRGPRPRRPARGGGRLPGRPAARPSSARSSRCSPAWRIHRDDARVLLLRELDSDGYRRWLDDYAEFVRHEGVAVAPVAPTRAAPRPRHRRVADPGRVRAGPGVRAGPALGRRRHAPRAPDRRQVAALLARVRAGRRSAPDADALIARVTALQDHLGLMNDADVTAHLARAFLVEHAGRPERRSRARRSGATSSAASGRSPGCAGRSGRSGGACRGSVPAGLGRTLAGL